MRPFRGKSKLKIRYGMQRSAKRILAAKAVCARCNCSKGSYCDKRHNPRSCEVSGCKAYRKMVAKLTSVY